MPKFDPSGEVAHNIERTPGRWLVHIPREVTLGKDKGPRPGIETIDRDTGQPRTSKNTGHEMWSAAAVVIDDHPDAPRDAVILGINLLWGGKGRDATYALLRVLGHPVDAWKRETDPAKLPDVTPEFFYDRPFVLETDVDDRGFLQPKGFCPYFAPTARRGPAAPAKGSAGANAGGGARGAAKSSGAPVAPPHAAARGAPVGDIDALPF